MNKKNNSLVMVLMGVIIVILAVLCVLFATNTISLSTSVENEKETEKVDNHTTNDEINVSKLNEIAKGEISFIKRIYYGENSFGITPEGKVLVGFNNYVSGVNKAKDIIVFDNMEKGTILYILDNNGKLYQYDLKNMDENNYEAIENTQYSNIKRIFEYQTLKKNAGGCMRLVVIDNDDNYKEIDSNCV